MELRPQLHAQPLLVHPLLGSLMQPPDFASEALGRLPLAEAVLRLWQWQTEAPSLDDLFNRHAGAGYTKLLTFATLVCLIRDALLEHGGSGRQSFQQGREQGRLPVTAQAAYQQLARLPESVSEAFLATTTGQLLDVYPVGQRATPDLPESLQGLEVIVPDGKAVKRVPRRLRPLRDSRGGLVGGKALVALHLATGLAVAMASSPDGDTNEASLVPDLLPQLQPRCRPILWVADSQFGKPALMAAFTAREGDHVVVRSDGASAFERDPKEPVRTGVDGAGRCYAEDWGWLGAPRNKERRYVRRITLTRPGAAPLILLTDLLDATAYPAVDLLAGYWKRWGIERVFQQITEVFHLQRLIGTTPRGTLFQLAVCLVWYNQVQVVRAYVAEAAQRPVPSVSSELLFADVRRQLIALNEVVEPAAVVQAVGPPRSGAAVAQRLRALLAGVWTERWRKSPAKKNVPRQPREKKREPSSAYRLIQKDREGTKKRPQM
jgi:hypothetical protein